MLADKTPIVVRLLIAGIVVAAISIAAPTRAKHPQDQKPPAASAAQLSDEPVMRIALSTDTRAATISTTAQLVKVSDFDGNTQPLETTRIRVESRLLAPAQPATENVEIVVARSISRDDADRLIDSVHELADEEATAVAEPSDKWRVVVVKHSIEDAEDSIAKLQGAGFDAETGFKVPTNETTLPGTSATNSSTDLKPAQPKTSSLAVNGGNVSALRTPSPANRVKLTAKATSPNREVVAFAAGLAPLHSSAPVQFGSSDEKNAPVRFNDKPYRGRIEVFANRRGSLTVVNVIGMEDYVRGVVPNELGFPALEALKAQAIAARTYALKNRNQFAPEGFDLLPTTRSQVYRGLTSETTLATRAVDETRGIVATYNGEPINALYTSTCGGRTEDAENIFNQAVPYLRSRECAAEMKAPFAPFTIKSSRDLFEIKDERDLVYARDAALLIVNGLSGEADHISSSWLAAHVTELETRDWLSLAARLSRNSTFKAPEEATRLGAFSTALVEAIYAEKRADILLNSADIDYLLSLRDADEIPNENRPDVAMLVRDGAVSLFADATLRPKEPLTRGRALHAIARMLESRGSLQLQRGNTRPATNGIMMLRSAKSKEQPIVVSRDAFLFRQFGETLYQMKSLALVGGEPVAFHLSAKGEVDYLEVKPAIDGASAERFSPFTNWTSELSVGQVQARLARSVRGIGTITDLRVLARGASRRVIDLEVVGTQGTSHIRGGRIRSALGLREQLFVIDRVYANDRVAGFVFTGRGWGHGVGMCQYGAYGLAKQGLNVEQILKTYYTGIDLTKLYN
jgi:stage II sporulation protein D